MEAHKLQWGKKKKRGDELIYLHMACNIESKCSGSHLSIVLSLNVFFKHRHE